MRWELRFGWALVWFFGVAWAHAQEPRNAAPDFASVEIKEDRSVVLRVYAPEAKKVQLNGGDVPGSSLSSRDLVRNEQGVWELSTSPVPPGSYRYTFGIDGVSVVDPRNPSTSESNSNTWSLFRVPGSAVSDLQDVPHGAIAAVSYYSKSLQRFRRAHVYTPPGYEQGTDALPVFYLLHGASDSDASWSTVGRAGLVLDNLIAAKKAVPMVVVMPMGHTGPFRFGPGGNFQQQMSEFAQDFVNDLKPMSESRYRISAERRHRAIAGLSMGGAQTLDIVCAQPDQFAYVGVFSSGVFGISGVGPDGNKLPGPTWEERHRATLDGPALRDGLRLLWFATGKEDFLLKTTQETVQTLKNHGLDAVYLETDGGHTWIKWREHYLPEFAAQLFRDAN